jgi:hypothetical protein
MAKESSRRKFLRDSLAAGTGVAATGFYTTLLGATQAVADDGANIAMNQEQKEFLERLAGSTQDLDPRALWAYKSGDGDKYGGPMEEFSQKKK